MKLRLLLTPVFLILPVLFLFSGCSVFSPIGDAIAGGYENAIAYFNSYYNASRLFGEAQDEILANERAARGKSGISPDPIPAPPSAKQKLTLVIDKCSNILSFYPSSALVDDALFLIGKSYFYQGEYLKAERKFAELLSGFPESSSALEGELWFLRTLSRLKKYDEASEAAEILLQRAKEEGEDEIVAEVYAVRGEVFAAQNDRAKALESYREAVEYSSNDLLRSYVQYRIAGELYQAGEFGEAARAFLKVEDFTDESGIVISSRLYAIRSFRQSGEFEAALEECAEAEGDFRFVQHGKEIMLERGLTYAAQGEIDRAIPELMKVDTSSARTEIGGKAAFEVAKLQEFRLGNYRSALEAYGRATAYPSPAILNEARRRHQALNRYFTVTRQREVRDSLLAVSSSLMEDDSVDSLFARPTPETIDSLQSEQAVGAYELGETFYAELENPDSAVFWYNQALQTGIDTTKSPRILFILAEISASHPGKHYGDSGEYYRRILRDYPSSVYAMRSKIQLGMPVEPAAVDSGQIKYRRAEAAMEAGQFNHAIGLLREITRKHQVSPYAAKSEYAIGYLYEYHLAQPDSALKHYRTLVETYGSSSYAAAVRDRIQQSAATPPDTLSIPQNKPVPEEAPAQPPLMPKEGDLQKTSPGKRDE